MLSRIDRWLGNGWMGIAELLVTVLCLFFSLSIHEFAHGYAAYKMGDDTARNMGRLSISPFSHLDVVGALCMLLFGFGWAKPVPVNSRNFKPGKQKSGMMITSVAGPVSNLLVCFLCCLVYSVMARCLDGVRLSMTAYRAFELVVIMLNTLISMNIGLAVFNLIPIPPLDGSKILSGVLPARAYFRLMQYERYGFLVLIILMNTSIFGNTLNFMANKILSVFQWLIGLLPFL